MMSTDASRAPYMFYRDFRSSIRLTHNHWLMKELAGSLLHPDIPTNKPDLRIADVGTGTAIWPLELAAKLPSSVRIDGFDISPDQFPPPSSRPENLHLHVHDAFTPFAPEYLGAFDVVHARFWLCIVNNPDAPVLLEKLISLLKPGGYLQWFEPLPLSALTVLAEDMLAAPATDRLTNSWHKPKLTSTYEWVEELPEAFKAHGLEVVSDDQIPMLKHYRAVWGHSMLAGLEDTASNVKLLGVEKSEEIRQWIVDLSDEFAQGASLDTTFICVVGKPGVLETW